MVVLLVYPYAKCGSLAKAKHVLLDLRSRNIVSWNALMSGYVQQGQGEEALSCFEKMQDDGLFPDDGTFQCVLCACGHSGLLDEAQLLFNDMTKKYGITPTLEHHTCLVEAFGFAGDFDKAVSMIKVMPSCDDISVWLGILGACRKWGNVELGSLVFDQTVQLDDSCIAAYVLMANTFVAAGMQEDAERVETMRMKYTACSKHQGASVWVDVSGNIHSFPLRDTMHCQNNRAIHAKVNDIILKTSQKGYAFATLSEKSEFLAIACALVNAFQEETIHILNSMPISADCHAAIAIISNLERRKITLKDPGSLHVFEDGMCYCAARCEYSFSRIR